MSEAVLGLVVGRNPVDGGALLRAFVQPAHRESLGITVDQRWRRTAQRIVASEVGCERSLPRTALGVQNDDLVKIASIWCRSHRSTRFPTLRWRTIGSSRHSSERRPRPSDPWHILAWICYRNSAEVSRGRPGSCLQATERPQVGESPNGRIGGTPALGGARQAKASGNLARTSRASSLEVCATGGKSSMRSYGIQALMTQRVLYRAS